MPPPLDLTGRVFGRLTVLRRVENCPRGNCQWLCDCKCGKQTIVVATKLSSGNTKSCGCGFFLGSQISNANKFRDLSGQRFGHLKVVDIAFHRNKQHYWQCICKCGAEMIINGHSLKQGYTRSCGCYQREQSSKANKRACKTKPRFRGRFAKQSSEGVA